MVIPFFKSKSKGHCTIAIMMLLICMGNSSIAQYSSKNLSDKHRRYYDSLKAMNYDRVFPLLGAKVYKRGFDIPFPFGIMVNSFYGVQGIDISNIRVGITTSDTIIPPVDLSSVIEFSDVTATALNLNARVDMWVLPFLNVYGIVGYFPQAQTKVVLSKPVQITSEPEQTGWFGGFGIMGAGGVGPVWLQADYNATWADMELLQNKVFTQVVGLRVGHTFVFKNNPEKNFGLWIGMMGIFLNNNTVGEIALDDVFSGISQEKIDEIKQSYGTWYNTLNPVQQKVADLIVDKLQDFVNGISTKDVHISYQMDKTPSARWAGLVGAQYQFNKRWQLRAESNFIGKDRFSMMLSLNYRFMGFRKKQ